MPPKKTSEIEFYNYHEYFIFPQNYNKELAYLVNPVNINNRFRISNDNIHNDQETLRSTQTNLHPINRINDNNSHQNESRILNLPDMPTLLVHHPNSYYPEGSLIYNTTRIIRVPREFQTYGDIVPQFSTYFPGSEPGAIKSKASIIRQKQEEQLQRKRDDGQSTLNSQPSTDNIGDRNFAVPVRNPLHNYLTETQFSTIINTVNGYLKQAFWPYSWRNILDCIVGFLTLWVLSGCFVNDSFIQHHPQVHDYEDPTWKEQQEQKQRNNLSSLSKDVSDSSTNNNNNNSSFNLHEMQSVNTVINSNNSKNDRKNGRFRSYLAGLKRLLTYRSNTAKTLIELENYITDLNKRYYDKNIIFISPKRAGYLSFDIQIPSPLPGEQYEI